MILKLMYLSVVLGVGGTVIMDLWALFQAKVLKQPGLNYAMVGRWLGHMPRGKFIHSPIAASDPIRGEAMLGWGFHYLTGIIYAAIILMIWGVAWASAPTLLPALIVAWIGLLAPFFLMQPGLGAGIAACKTPKPWFARFKSFITHTSFGVGLYLTALGYSALLGV
ncbi:DUF2938 domain-containing protein [Woodsholea maritima]|uniref:DUF2938 domain-containing protein n=1 Tax=Woodsholea maritima TaxID=240237 RepID=UPI0003A63694|nr:DUF2938 domain-containing protein [Woodsholea maritima]